MRRGFHGLQARGGGGAEGLVCITFGYVKPTLTGSRQVEAEDGGVKGKV